MSEETFFSSGPPAAKFPEKGASVQGTIVGKRITQQTKYQTNEPEFWPLKPGEQEPRPKMQLLIEIQTGETDPSIPGDDGVRTIYVKGKQLEGAVRQALRDANHRGDPEIGGEIWVKFDKEVDTKDDKGNIVSSNKTKVYVARYKPKPADAFFPAEQSQPAPAQNGAPAREPVFASSGGEAPPWPPPQSAPPAATPPPPVRDDPPPF